MTMPRILADITKEELIAEVKRARRSERVYQAWVTILDWLMNKGMVEFQIINDLLTEFEDQEWSLERLEQELEKRL